MADGHVTSLTEQLSLASWDGARLTRDEAPGMVTVRARAQAQGRVAHALGLAHLPEPNGTAAQAALTCYWIRPDEWLLAVPFAARGATIELLEGALAHLDTAVLDVSASRVVLELSGPSSADVLASCCSLDLHRRVFPVGRCAQSLIAKAPMLLHHVSDAPAWRIFVRPTLVRYVADWLIDGMNGVRAEAGRAAPTR